MAAFDYSSDDDEDKCPLCIEDMDITDKSFKPCPCGFQICQFCYNNIRSGPEQYNRCPACRRPYDEASIEYRTLTSEEMKQEQERKQRKEQIRKQRERERNKETHHPHFDQRDKKHLANVRVIQKNLVYVIGLNPNIPSEDLQQMLRRDEFFGQYGKIQKIVVNKRVNGNGNLGVGVYVTFARKEDAARCIAAVDGSVNDGKYLRAAYGTTKYCSSYLRGQNCPNQNCMFLHEPGEEADNFNRHPGSAGQQSSQGLSSISQGLHSHGLPSQSGQAGQVSQQHTPVSAHSGLSLQGMSPGGHNSSASASPVSVHSALASHNSAGSASANASTGSASALSAPGSASSSLTGATLTVANAPALPAWGKVQPQIPPVQKLTVHDLIDPAADSLRLLEKNRVSLSSDSWHFKFVSEMVDTDAKFPAMFSLPLDDQERLNTYHSAIAELDRLLEASKPKLNTREESSGSQDDTNVSTASAETPKKDSKLNNSQHLLAHLMRDVSPAPSQPEGHSEDDGDDNNDSNDDSNNDDSNNDDTLLQDEFEASTQQEIKQTQRQAEGKVRDSKSSEAQTQHIAKEKDAEEKDVEELQKQKASLHQSLLAVTEKYNLEPDQLQSSLADVLRRVGGDLMQPPSAIEAQAIETSHTKRPTNLVDDGPKFDLRNLPHVPVVGDTAPSVWAAIEEHSRLRDLLARREKEFVAAKAQTKKRAKRIRVGT